MIHPQRYAHGLIPFCRENPDIRIESWIDLWRTVLLGLWKWFKRLDSSKDILDSLMGWIDETLLLQGNGMPDNTFSLVFYT
jgi:hypothetical protein